MNAFKNLEQYLANEFDASLVPDETDDGPYYYPELAKLIEEYGKEQRKEGYMKGFEDGENADG